MLALNEVLHRPRVSLTGWAVVSKHQVACRSTPGLLLNPNRSAPEVRPGLAITYGTAGSDGFAVGTGVRRDMPRTPDRVRTRRSAVPTDTDVRGLA